MLLVFVAQAVLAAPAVLKLDVRLNGKDVGPQATIMVTGGQLAIPVVVNPGSADPVIKLAPGKYAVTVLLATDQPSAAVLPAQFEVSLKDGQTLTKKIELKSLDMRALGKGFAGKGAAQAGGAPDNAPAASELQSQRSALSPPAAEAPATLPDKGGTPSVMRSLLNMLSTSPTTAPATPPPDRLAAFERCAGFPAGYLGKAPHLPPGAQAPRFRPVAPAVASGPAGSSSTTGDILQSMAVDSSNAAANAHALAGDMRQLPGLIESGQWPEILALIRHAHQLLNAARSASEATDRARAQLLATLNKPFAGHKGLDLDFAGPLQRALLSWKQRVRDKGLTPDEIAALRAKGMNGTQIAAWRETALHLPIDAIIVDFMQLQLIERTGLGTPPAIDWQQTSTFLDKLEKGVSSCAHAR